MRSVFTEQLTELNNEMMEMGALIEHAIAAATKALVERDVKAAEAAIVTEREVDEKERKIEALCVKLLLQQQPVARDLRYISSALKMITDMERIGDQASDISGLVIYLAKEEYIKELVHLPEMARAAIGMVRDSVDAFVKQDLELARSVPPQDDVIDSLFDTIKNELIECIQKDASTGSQAMDLLMIAKYFERIGDHAENIAEWVEYSITGRHKGEGEA